MRKILSFFLMSALLAACNGNGSSTEGDASETTDSLEESNVIVCFDDMTIEQLKETWGTMAKGAGELAEYAIKDIDGDGLAELALKDTGDTQKVLILSKDVKALHYSKLQSLAYDDNIIFSTDFDDSREGIRTTVTKIDKSVAVEYFQKTSVWNDKKGDSDESYVDMLTGKEYSRDKAESILDKFMSSEKYLYFDWKPIASWNNPDAEIAEKPLAKSWKKKLSMKDFGVDVAINDKGEVLVNVTNWNEYNSMGVIAPKYEYSEPLKSFKLKGLTDKAVGLYSFWKSIYIIQKNKNVVHFDLSQMLTAPVPYVSTPICEHGLYMEEEQQEETILYLVDENKNSFFFGSGMMHSLCVQSESDNKYRYLNTLVTKEFVYVEGSSPSDLDVIYFGTVNYLQDDKFEYTIKACKKKGKDWEKSDIEGVYICKSGEFSTEEQIYEVTPIKGLNLLQGAGEKMGEPRKAMYSYHFMNK